MLRFFAVLIAFAFPAVPAALAQSGVDEPGLEQSFIRGILGGLGVIGSDKPQIDYRERAPLVVPGNRDALPAPQDAAAARNPAWPNDPDVERQRRLAKNTEEGKKLERGVLTRDQLAASSAAGAGRVNSPQIDRQRILGNYNPSQVENKTFSGGLSSIGRLIGRDDDEQKPVEFTGEPDRRSLVEPPPGFRTPSPNAPYGPVGKKVDDKTVTEQRKTGRP